MFLRRTLEQKLKVKDDEVRLPDSVSGSIFRGSYLLPTSLTKIENITNYSPKTRDAYPYQRKITKTYSDGSKVFKGDSWDDAVYSKPISYEDLDIANSPECLRRATRIERIARRIKFTALAVGAITLAGMLTIGSISESNESDDQTPIVPACESVANDGESLLGLTSDQVDPAQQLGQTVCSINDGNYLVIMPAEAR